MKDEFRREEIEGEKVLDRLARLDPYWGAQLVILAAILLDLALSHQVSVVHPTWLLPGLQGLALIAVAIASPHPRLRHSPLRRHLSLAVIGLVSAANSASLVLLCEALLRRRPATGSGPALLGSGIVLWTTNVLLFGVWFWMLDRGGPQARSGGEPGPPDFLFVQMASPEHAPPGWEPRLIDYLYTSFTNATAFSPTDTMPLTATAKSLMTLQSLTALVTIGLVVARAVNILT